MGSSVDFRNDDRLEWILSEVKAGVAAPRFPSTSRGREMLTACRSLREAVALSSKLEGQSRRENLFHTLTLGWCSKSQSGFCARILTEPRLAPAV